MDKTFSKISEYSTIEGRLFHIIIKLKWRQAQQLKFVWHLQRNRRWQSNYCSLNSQKIHKNQKRIPPYLVSNRLFPLEILFAPRKSLRIPPYAYWMPTTPWWLQLWQGGVVTYPFVFLPIFPLFSHLEFGVTCDDLAMAWQCLLCAGFTALLLTSLLTHYNSEHYRSHEDRLFNIRCEIDRCTKEYSKVNSFTKHVRIVHRKFLSCTSPIDTGGEPCLFEGNLCIELL